MINVRELHNFLKSFREMCQDHPGCKGCELVLGECLYGGWESGTTEQMEKVILAVERWKTKREKEIAKRELKEFVERLAKVLEGDARIEDGALVIKGSGAGQIRFELGGDDGKA